MKNVLCIIAILMSCLISMNAQQKIEFSGKKITINGWAKQLVVLGHEKDFVSIEMRNDDTDSENRTSHEKQGDELKISLEINIENILIYVPENMDLNIAMETVMWEGSFDREKDWRGIKIKDTKGDLELDSDGYHVHLDNLTGSLAVVTYGNIYAEFSDLSKSEVVSLDTYLGNVEVAIPTSVSANITMRAKSGEVSIDSNLPISETTKKSKKKLTAKLNEGTLPIILHSEGGEYVSLKAKR